MRIHSIANSPTFGYDKKLNEEVNRKLRKAEKQKKSPEARDTAKYLREMNEYCMRMEDSLRAAEKHHDENRVDLYDDLFTIPKSIIVDKINERFPALDYRRRELEGYKKEQKERHLENDEYHWLSGVVSNISKTIEYDEAVAAAQLDINEEILKTKKEIEQELNDYKNGAADEANGISRTKTKSEKDVKNLVEKFIPNEFSPTGFESIGGMAAKINLVSMIPVTFRVDAPHIGPTTSCIRLFRSRLVNILTGKMRRITCFCSAGQIGIDNTSESRGYT